MTARYDLMLCVEDGVMGGGWGAVEGGLVFRKTVALRGGRQMAANKPLNSLQMRKEDDTI